MPPLFHHQDRQWVFVAGKEGSLTGYRATPIVATGRKGDEAIVSGLPGNSLIVTRGVAALKANWLGIGKE